MEIIVDPLHQVTHVGLVQLIFEKFPRLGGIQFLGSLLVDQADALETVPAFLGAVEQAAAGAELVHHPVVLEQQKVVLEHLQISRRVGIMKSRKDFPDAGIVLFKSIRIADFPLIIGGIGKFQQISFAGRQFPVKFLLPHLITLITAHDSGLVHHPAVFIRDLQGHF